MDIYIEKDNRNIELKESLAVKDLLKKLSINPQTVLVVKNDEIVLHDEMLSEKDTVKILSVISGG